MSKAKTTEAKINKGAGKVANAIAKVYEIVGQSGSVVTQCVTSAMSVYKGAAIPQQDLRFIADNVARIRKWTSVSARARKSEVRKILKQYTRLPEAIDAYCAKHDAFTWHTAVKLARCLDREPALRPALALMSAQTVSKAATPAKALGTAISKAMNVETRTAKIVAFQGDLEQLCEKHGIDW